MFLLLPAFAAAAPPPWAESLATGDCPAVVVALPTTATAGERMGLGYCLERMDRDEDADPVLAQVTGPLAPYATLIRARARLDAGDPRGALTLIETVSLPGAADDLLRARARLGAGRTAEATALLAGMAPSPEVRLLQAEALEAAHADAVPTWRELWTRYPTSAEADTAAERLAASGHPVDAATDAPTRAAMLARARRLVAISQAPLAIPLFDAVHAVAPPTTPAERLELADALFDAHVYPRARALYAAVGADTTNPRTAFRYALATARAGDYDAAAPLYAALTHRWPDAKEADEASWKPGYMDYDAGRLAQAVVGFERYVAARPAGRFAGEARWLRAWSLYKLGDEAGALDAMAPIAAGGGEFAAPAAYWTARSRSDEGALAAVVKRFPKTSYAYFASQRLGLTPAVRVVPPMPATPAGLAAAPAVATARALIDAGFPGDARTLLVGTAALATDDATAVALAGLYADAELYQAAQKLACPRVTRVPAAAAACWPRPHAGAVTEVASRYGLDPLLPYAVMNAESGLDPTVTSPAGARGLMQLMPLLAAPLAAGRVPGFVADDLYRAGINARLGTTELGELHRRFADGPLQPALPLVIAGYNGGGDAVQRWVDVTPAGVDVDRWAEDISYAETRKYVRRVLGYLMEYRGVWGS